MKRTFLWLAAAYALLIAYGSLFPFSFVGGEAHLSGLLAWPKHYSGTDVLTNLLAYMPLGLLLGLAWQGRRSPLGSSALALLIGTALSLCMELVQQFEPARDASLLDLALNAAGTLAGALVGTALHAERLPGRTLLRWRTRWIRPGRLCDLGLLAIGLWTLSQVAPLVPSLDIGNLRQGLSPLWQVLQDPSRFNVAQWAVYTLSIAGLALLFKHIADPGRAAFTLFFGFVGAVLLYKVPVVGRQLSAEALGGAALAVLVCAAFVSLRARARAWIAALLVLGAFVVAEFAGETSGRFYAFNWAPFRGQLSSTLTGMAAILQVLWPAAALAYLTRVAVGERARAAVAWLGAAALAVLTFALEWNQQFLPGRYGDITTVCIVAGVWLAYWAVPLDKRAPREAVPLPQPQGLRHAVIASLAGLIAIGSAYAIMIAKPAPERRASIEQVAQLAAPEALPLLRLPAFRSEHPRLPHPAPEEIATLVRHNTEFVSQLRLRANRGAGDLEGAVLQELIEPGSVDLRMLHSRLMALKFAWRGHAEVKPLAVAYDWLHARWSAEQRRTLAGKLAEGCEYLIELIRKDRLSPYNVILYNAPLQALMACSIALYQDDPRGDPIMAFTHDLWAHRVLPVWRQVMGRNGGWHEGGEYIGIGIGQAIWQLPAMWRHATGEDFVAAEPGIRGFLDFLVYRTQPDGTHFRWGDAAWFNRIVPDALPLALELRHAAAYTLLGRPGAPVPTGWPWGPLTDDTLLDTSALARLPLDRHFDGLGMVVARSDWSPQATYVNFKAGDNYWSHAHLDQGAFTIYKGGPLAIDSGLYGPVYGSDHHMNYTYQTIAHNTVTVSDPRDTVPLLRKDKPRAIANDGGQRRVGSGWGIERGPIDLAEWQDKRDIYHTGSIEALLQEDGLVAALANVTPAYTNRESGHGTFSHRTRRVERFSRVFGYDRVEDAIVVFDQVNASRAEFRKRWLLHTLHAPEVSAQGFTVRTPVDKRPGRSGGRLEGRVLLPKNARIHAIGGPGFDFHIDGQNYDEDGALGPLITKLGPNQGEPGAWRIELSPRADEAEDSFLVVLLPTSGGPAPQRVRLLEAGDKVGCEIAGTKRTTRWWFDPKRNRTEIEVLVSGATRRYRLEGHSKS